MILTASREKGGVSLQVSLMAVEGGEGVFSGEKEEEFRKDFARSI